MKTHHKQPPDPELNEALEREPREPAPDAHLESEYEDRICGQEDCYG